MNAQFYNGKLYSKYLYDSNHIDSNIYLSQYRIGNVSSTNIFQFMKFYSFEYTSNHLKFETALFIFTLITWSIAQIKFLKYFDHANTKNSYHFYLIL